MFIRFSKESDKDKIKELTMLCFGDRDHCDILKGLNKRYLLAFDSENNLLAMTGLLWSNEYNAYEMDWTCTHPKYRKQGIMHELFKRLCELTDEDIYCSCWRYDENGTINLNSLMKAFGFEEIIRTRVTWDSRYNCCAGRDRYCVRKGNQEICRCYEDLYVRKRLIDEFKIPPVSNIVILHNTENTIEWYKVENGIYLQTIVDTVKSYKEEVIEFFQSMDKLFYDFLGIDLSVNRQEAIKNIQKILDSDMDGHHKHYIIKNSNKIIGIFYIYDYKTYSKRCNISIGLLQEYRGKGIAEKIITKTSKELLNQGITRVGLEVETTNSSSLKLCEKLDGFKLEGIMRNSYGVGIDSVIYSIIT